MQTPALDPTGIAHTQTRFASAIPMLLIPEITVLNGFMAQSDSPDKPSTRTRADQAISEWTSSGFNKIVVGTADVPHHRKKSAVDELGPILSFNDYSIVARHNSQSEYQIGTLLDQGAHQVILANRSVRNTNWLESITETFPGQLLIPVNFLHRSLAPIEATDSPKSVLGFLEDIEHLHLAGIILSPQGDSSEWNGAKLDLLEEIVELSTWNVIAQGVSEMQEIRALQHRGANSVILAPLNWHDATDPKLLADLNTAE